MLVAYVSGHGFGHATRTAEVLRQVRDLQPDRPITVVTAAPEELFRAAIAEPLSVRSLECDVGLVQKDALVIDTEATADRWREFRSRWDDLVDSEAAWLAREKAAVVLGDIPPLAFEAAFRASVPSVGVANFSWDWIYRHVAHGEPFLTGAAEAAAAAYARARLLLRLPFHGDLSVFRRIEDIPLVARRPVVERAAARAALGFGARSVVVVSFGGLGLPGFQTSVLSELPEYDFVLPGPPSAEDPPNVRVLEWADLAEQGLTYPDLLGAADAVVTKPGYGIVTECIAAGTPIVYTDRGDFPEYPILVEGMVRYLPCAYVDNDAVRRADLDGPLKAVLGRTVPPPPPLGGARVAAARILEIAEQADDFRPRRPASVRSQEPGDTESTGARSREPRRRRRRRSTPSPLVRWLRSTGFPVASRREAFGLLGALAILTAALALASLLLVEGRAARGGGSRTPASQTPAPPR